MSGPDSGSTLVRHRASMSRIVFLLSAPTSCSAVAAPCRAASCRLRQLVFGIVIHLKKLMLGDQAHEPGLIEFQVSRSDLAPIAQPIGLDVFSLALGESVEENGSRLELKR